MKLSELMGVVVLFASWPLPYGTSAVSGFAGLVASESLLFEIAPDSTFNASVAMKRSGAPSLKLGSMLAETTSGASVTVDAAAAACRPASSSEKS